MEKTILNSLDNHRKLGRGQTFMEAVDWLGPCLQVDHLSTGALDATHTELRTPAIVPGKRMTDQSHKKLNSSMRPPNR